MATLEARGGTRESIDKPIPPVSVRFPATKFAIPPVHAGQIRRTDALRRLRQGAVGQSSPTPVTVIHGYPGSGKSQLVASWMAEDAYRPQTASNAGTRLGAQSRPAATTDYVIWISCDHSDNDARRLWAALLAALGPIIGDMPGESSPPLAIQPLDEGGNPPFDVLAAVVVNRLIARDVTVSIVLDDAHRAGDAIASLGALIDRLPAGNRLILTTTRTLPLSLHSLRVRRQVTELRQEHLDLSIDEVRRLLSIGGGELDGREVVRLHRATEGWLAPWALYLSRLDSRDAGRRPDSIGELTRVHVGATPLVRRHRPVVPSTSRGEPWIDDPSGLDDFFRHAVLMEVDDPIRDFLLDVALLDEFTADDCRHVFADVGDGETLRTCAAHGLFVVGPDTHGTFRLHGMFKDFLRRERSGRDPERDAMVHHRAAETYGASGRITLAVRHHVLGGQLRQALDLIVSKLSGGGVERHESVVKKWLGEVHPDDVRDSRSAPVYAAFAFALAAVGDADAARQWTAAAAEMPGSDDDDVRALISMVDLRVGLHVGDSHQIHRGCDGLYDAGSSRAVASRPIIARVGMIAARTWDDDPHGALAISAEHRPDRANSTVDDVCVASTTAYTLAVQGELHRARELGEWSIAAGRALGISKHWPMATADLACALADYEQGHYKRSLERFSMVLARFGDRSPTAATLATAGRLRAQIATGTPDMDAVERMLTEAQRLTPTSPLHDAVTTLQVRVAVALGEFGRALELIADLNTPWRTGLWTARVSIATGDTERAATALEPLVPPASRRGKIDLAVVNARLARRTKDDATAARYVDEALALAVPELAVRPFFEDGTDLWSIMRRRLSSYPNHQFHDVAREMATLEGSVRRSVPVEPSTEAAAVLSTLRNREQEVLRLIAAKHPNRDIAAMMYISLNTLKTHTRALYRKLGVSSRSEVIALAEKLGVV